MQTSPVTTAIAKNQTEVLVPTEKEGECRVMLSQHVIVFENGFARRKRRTTWQRGTFEVFKSLGLDKEGARLNGKICEKSSFNPFYPGQPPVKNPDTDEIILRSGRPFYRNYYFTEDVTQVDTWVDNVAVSVSEMQPEEQGM